MNRSDRLEYRRLADAVASLQEEGNLPLGIGDPGRADAFIMQLVESLRRVRYIELISSRRCGPQFADPASSSFDPLRALVHFRDVGVVDESFWMAFIHVHFGKNRRWGWEYPRRVYGALGEGDPWTWDRVAADIGSFRSWLCDHEKELTEGPGGFGNHRKYESLSGSSAQGTGAVVESYVDWVCTHGSHEDLIAVAVNAAGGDPVTVFEWLTQSASSNVVRFGRTGSFDYVNLLSWTGLIPATAGTCHIAGSTGPRSGAELMYGSGERAEVYERELANLCTALDVPFDVMEDALCNWQKSPDNFKAFRG